jgi:hypothetical protein
LARSIDVSAVLPIENEAKPYGWGIWLGWSI